MQNKQVKRTQSSTLRCTWVVFIILSVVANIPAFANAIVATPSYLAASIITQGITLYLVVLSILGPRITLLLYGILLLTVFPLDAISIIGTGSPLSYGITSAVLHTTSTEAFPQIKANLTSILAFLAAISIYFVALFRCIPLRFKLSNTTRIFAPLAALYLTLSVTQIASLPYARELGLPKNEVVQRITDESFILLFPIRDVKLIGALAADDREISESIAMRQPFADSLFTTIPGFDSSCIGMLSIGETSRACHWQLAGYERATNPNLIRRDNLFFYADAYSGSNLTEFAAPMYYSNDTPQKIRTWQTRPILNEIFRSCGIATGLVTSQGQRSQWRTTSFMLLASSAEKSKLITSYGVEPHVPDEQLIAPTADMLTMLRQPLFVTFWGYGGHHEYCDRYPKRDEVFTPANKKNRTNDLNAFDNTIIHTDRVHDSLISLLEATKKPAFLIYAADHGEVLYDVDNTNHYHGTTYFCHGEAHVPCFVWLSKEYIKEYPDIADALTRNLAKPVQTNAVFHTVQHLMHAVGPDFDSTLSLASPSYRAHAPREGLNADCKLKPAPEYDSLKRQRVDQAILEQLQRHKHLLKEL